MLFLLTLRAMANETTSRDTSHSNLERFLKQQYPQEHPIESFSPEQIAIFGSPPTIYRSLSDEQKILTPVPNPQLENAVSRWLLSKDTNTEEIQSGKALCKAIGIEDPPDGLRRCLKCYVKVLLEMNVSKSQVPNVEDLRLCRNWPRVLNSIANYAYKSDNDNWIVIASDEGDPLLGSRSWEEETINEEWEGDNIVRELINVINTDSLTTTILVAGSQGSGKSATIETIMNRPAIPHSHALTLIKDDKDMDPRERETLRKYRHLKALFGTGMPFDLDAPMASQKVSKISCKVDGKVVMFIEMPSFEKAFENRFNNGSKEVTVFGSEDNVTDDLLGEKVNLAIVVERLDELDLGRLKRHLRILRRFYGKQILQRTVVVLTHGESLPPNDMSYEIWTFNQTRKVSEVLSKLKGEEMNDPVPVVIFENSKHCQRDSEDGYGVLPNGDNFSQTFLTKVREITSMISDIAPLEARPDRKWWNVYFVMGILSLLVARIR